MSDDRVLQGALEDGTGTAAHIEELRAQFAQQERHLEEIDQFVATYRHYASVETVNATVSQSAFT